MNPLTKITEGKKVKILKIEGNILIQKRLKDLGILKNEKIFIIKNDRANPMIVNVKGAKIALGRILAKNIEVEELNA